MKFGKNVALLGMALSLFMIFLAVETFVGDGVLPGWNGFFGTGKNEGTGFPDSLKESRFETYDVVVGDYRVSFDYLPGMKSYDTMNASGVVSMDFYSDSLDSITLTTVPAKFYTERPRTAEEYKTYRENESSEDIVSVDVEAEDFVTGDWEGFLYREVTEYAFGSTGYVSGYQLFCGDEYMYIFTSRYDGMPRDIENLRIEKL